MAIKTSDFTKFMIAGGNTSNLDPSTSFTNPINYSPSNSGDVTSHFRAIDQQLGNSSGSTSPRTNRQELSSNITLSNTSKEIQYLLNKSGVVLTVNLPANPNVDTLFIVKNRESSENSIYINNVTLLPGEIWNGIWDGVEWIEI